MSIKRELDCLFLYAWICSCYVLAQDFPHVLRVQQADAVATGMQAMAVISYQVVLERHLEHKGIPTQYLMFHPNQNNFIIDFECHHIMRFLMPFRLYSLPPSDSLSTKQCFNTAKHSTSTGAPNYAATTVVPPLHTTVQLGPNICWFIVSLDTNPLLVMVFLEIRFQCVGQTEIGHSVVRSMADDCGPAQLLQRETKVSI